jgi:5-methylcytosine-specific restriction endonuclease McrA
MNSAEYKLLLQHEKWTLKSTKIKQRDNYKCTKCGDRGLLNVHHTYYYPGKLPWEYPDKALITLCDLCHQWEHVLNPPKYKKRKGYNNKDREKRRDLISGIIGRVPEEWEY